MLIIDIKTFRCEILKWYMTLPYCDAPTIEINNEIKFNFMNSFSQNCYLTTKRNDIERSLGICTSHEIESRLGFYIFFLPFVKNVKTYL